MCYTVNTHLNQQQLEVLTGKKISKTFAHQPSLVHKGFSFSDLPISSSAQPEEITTAKWGLVPHWVGLPDKAAEMRQQTLNARIETLQERPSFKSLVDHNRCVVWVAGFYEYRKEGTKKRPFYVYSSTGILPLAGLVEYHDTFGITTSIITTEANEQMAYIHNDKKRMPVALDSSLIPEWLDEAISFQSLQQEVISKADQAFLAEELVPDFQKRIVHFSSPLDCALKNTPQQGSLF